MPRSALQSVAQLDKLRQAWIHIRDRARATRGGSPGIDGQRPSDFRRSESTNLEDIALSLAAKKYRFRDLTVKFLDKPDGGTRTICIPTVRDRITQRAILHYLTIDDKCNVLNSVSFGFTKDRTVQDAVSLAISKRNRKPWVYKTDISKFFDNLNRDRLKAVVHRKVRHRSLHPLLIDAACREIYEPNAARAKRVEKLGIQPGRGIRQGMPLSPFFSNLFLHKFDRGIENTEVGS